jgi:hypothetical protein
MGFYYFYPNFSSALSLSAKSEQKHQNQIKSTPEMGQDKNKRTMIYNGMDDEMGSHFGD